MYSGVDTYLQDAEENKMIVLEERIFDGSRRCAVHRLCAKKLSWDFTIRTQDDFEDFIRQVSDAWERAEQDKMSLDFQVHQVES